MWPLESEVELTAPCFDFGFVQSICSGKIVPDITTLRFRNPDVFIAGQLHLHSEVWEKIASLSTYDRADEVLDWIKNKVSLFKFFRPFKGHFKGRAYDSVIPPRIEFDNNKSCNNFVDFIVNTLLERVCSGAISVLGRVGEVDPPHLVMPLTVEPTKPRLCHDNRFLNLWMVDRPFHLDNLSQLPRYLTKGCYQTTLDYKSGYDHILLDVSSRTFFGIRWRGWYFVSNTIPFGWKISAYVYHSTGLLVSHFLRSIGVPCSLYIDDRHNGELQSKTSYPSASTLATPSDETRLEASKAAVFLAAYTLTSLGYTLGLKKCVFTPQKRIKYLGFISDSDLEAFYLPPDKQTSFLALVNSILCGSCVSTVTLQRLAGKCISFRLAVQDSRLYTAEQLQAQATPKQATPFFVNDLLQLSHLIDRKLRSEDLTPIDMFVLLRDQAFFKTLFFSGDRPGDLSQVKTPEILRFPDNSGLLFNHVWGKTLRDGSSNLFAIRRNQNADICPVKAIDLYVTFAKGIGIDITSGFLFRPITPDGGIVDRPFSSSAADSRFRVYLDEGNLAQAATLHGFRSGCAITLALAGAGLQDVMGHVSWRHRSTATYYMQLSKVMSTNSPSTTLSGREVNIADTGVLYQNCNSLKDFIPAFPR